MISGKSYPSLHVGGASQTGEWASSANSILPEDGARSRIYTIDTPTTYEVL